MKATSKPRAASKAKSLRGRSAAKGETVAPGCADILDSAVKKYRTEGERRAAFERFAAEFGPKQGGRKRKTVDAVGFLIKLRRGNA